MNAIINKKNAKYLPKLISVENLLIIELKTKVLSLAAFCKIIGS